jgi:hypothetical protein
VEAAAVAAAVVRTVEAAAVAAWTAAVAAVVQTVVGPVVVSIRQSKSLSIDGSTCSLPVRTLTLSSFCFCCTAVLPSNQPSRVGVPERSIPITTTTFLGRKSSRIRLLLLVNKEDEA